MRALRIVLCVILYICLVATMLTAFGFSSQDGEKSDGVSKKAASVVTGKSIEEINKLEKEKGEDKVTVNGIIRKCAHFSIYLLMGVLSYLALGLTFNKKDAFIIAIALILCFAYASSDEIHQHFSNGRTAAFCDVVLDFSGSSLGTFLVCGIKKKLFNDKCLGELFNGKNS